MAQELIYTSISRGVRPGSSGFCTAGCTSGMSGAMVSLLESLSSYRPYYPHYTPQAVNNPVSYSHLLCQFGSRYIHVLSRICFSGMDYTGRSNFLAHHISAEDYEIFPVTAGPVAPFMQNGLFRPSWDTPAQYFPEPVMLMPQNAVLAKAETWERYTGDAGWADVLAQQFLSDPKAVVYVVFDPARHQDILSLVNEAVMLLPENLRWQVTFNTFFNTLAPGVSCNWRFCTADNSLLADALKRGNAGIIDLTAALPPADGELAQIARIGVIPQAEFDLPVSGNFADNQENYSAMPQFSSAGTFHQLPGIPMSNPVGPKKDFKQKHTIILTVTLLVLVMFALLAIVAVSGGFDSGRRSSSSSASSSGSSADDKEEKDTDTDKATGADKATDTDKATGAEKKVGEDKKGAANDAPAENTTPGKKNKKTPAADVPAGNDPPVKTEKDVPKSHTEISLPDIIPLPENDPASLIGNKPGDPDVGKNPQVPAVEENPQVPVKEKDPASSGIEKMPEVEEPQKIKINVPPVFFQLSRLKIAIEKNESEYWLEYDPQQHPDFGMIVGVGFNIDRKLNIRKFADGEIRMPGKNPMIPPFDILVSRDKNKWKFTWNGGIEGLEIVALVMEKGWIIPLKPLDVKYDPRKEKHNLPGWAVQAVDSGSWQKFKKYTLNTFIMLKDGNKLLLREVNVLPAAKNAQSSKRSSENQNKKAE